MRIGFQMVAVAAVNPSASDPASLDGLWTEAEQSACRGTKPPYLHQHLAGLMAAKLAVAQVLGPDATAACRLEVEVLPDHLGAPRLRLHGSAAALARARGLTSWHLSISHTDDYAAALVVAEKR